MAIPIKPSEKQCKFVAGEGKTKAIFMLRTLAERATEVKTLLFMFN